MLLETIESQFALYTLSGFPSFAATEQLEAAMLAEAAIDLTAAPSRERRSPTTFHLAMGLDGPLGMAASTVGPLAELPLGLALAAAGVDVATEVGLPDAACELVSLSVDGDTARDTTGVTEALYRSFYRQAKRAGAQSAVVGVDPWVFDVLREQYGVPFVVLGPPIELLGRELLAVGGDIQQLEAGIQRDAPGFFAYLTQPGVQAAGVAPNAVPV
jgi:hypothetical protein